MKSPISIDSRATGLLDRVREDVSHLRNDIGKLLTHTTRETLPNNARELADQAKQHFAAGSAYAASRLRGFRTPPQRHTGGWIGGAVLAGLIGYGVYMLCRDNGCATRNQANDKIVPGDEFNG